MVKKLSDAHNKAAAKTNFYWIMSVEQETPTDGAPPQYAANPWVVNFGVSTDKNDLDDHFDSRNHLSVRELKKIVEAPFKGKPDAPAFEFELYKNWHTARLPTKERAEQTASELVFLFHEAGLQPMAEDEHLYPAKIPGTNTVVAFTPPRNPNGPR